MTPLLTAKLAGKYVAVDATGLLMSTLQVRFPSLTSVQTGMTVYFFFHKTSRTYKILCNFSKVFSYLIK